MTLSAGTKLGPYEIVAALGAGGMGEVYRARDTRLSRDVAVKVLPTQRTPNPEARERFEREARTISQLTHPHICVLHDVGREGETEYLVMELLEGETLADRLGRGPLPLSQALRYGAEIAAALDAAHRRGIVHRDLKPGNVMLTKEGVKLLDFGLARGFVGANAGGLTEAPTIVNPLTADGVIVGTVAYMAPEQLEGQEADARTDIFALGAVLYEMLTGQKAFTGKSNATLISAILTSDPPPVSALQPITPPELDRLVRTCLAKDPAERWQSAHDVELQLRAGGASGPLAREAVTSKPAPRSSLPWIAAAVCAAVAAVALIRGRAAARPNPAIVRFSVPPPAPDGEFQYTAEGIVFAVSPDGTRIAYVAAPGPEIPRVWVRSLSSADARPLAGTESARSLMWSPDGNSIAFFTRDKLKRVELSGGSPVPICDVSPGGGAKAGTWGRSDIVFTNVQGGALYRVPSGGGQPVAVIKSDPAHGVMRLAWPWFLPDGERFLYAVREAKGWGSLMLAEPGKPPRRIMAMTSFFQFVEPGYLLYVRDGALVAQAFDLKSARPSGDPVAVAEHVEYFYSTAAAAFAARGTTIAYLSQPDVNRLAWFDRNGRELEKLGASGKNLYISLASGAHRLFFGRADPASGTFHIWSYDLDRGVETSVTSSSDTEAFPRLLADGKTLIFSAVEGGPPLLKRKDLATGKEEPLTEDRRAFQRAQDVSPDGRTLVFSERTDAGNFDIWTLPLDGPVPAKPTPFLQSPEDKLNVRFSPDGRYVAFSGQESGRFEIYVAPFPGPGEKVRVSKQGAQLLRWARDGELVYLTEDRRLVAVPVRTSPALEIGTSATLFRLTGTPWLDFEVTPDGQRFLAVVPEINGNAAPLNVIVNWAPGAR